MSSMFKPLSLDQMSHGIVNRKVTINGKPRVGGDPLSHADLASIAIANRNAMIENRFITVFPKSAMRGVPAQTLMAIEGTHHIFALGFNRYAVVKGVMLRDDLVGQDEAAKFVAQQETKTAAPKETKPASRAAASPAGGKKPRRKAASSRRRRRVAAPAAPAPAPDGEQPNGPVGT